jgi:hypothetical protein
MTAETPVGTTYRPAVSSDEGSILKVFAEVASEVPTAVRPQTEAYIKRFVGSGQSWVATDAEGKVVGYALAEPHDRETLSLVYLGVSKAARRDLLPRGQLDHVNRWRVAAFPA